MESQFKIEESWLTTLEFGIGSKSVEEAYNIDKETETDLWTKAIRKKWIRIKYI
jgi:hypothetical protein